MQTSERSASTCTSHVQERGCVEKVFSWKDLWIHFLGFSLSRSRLWLSVYFKDTFIFQDHVNLLTRSSVVCQRQSIGHKIVTLRRNIWHWCVGKIILKIGQIGFLSSTSTKQLLVRCLKVGIGREGICGEEQSGNSNKNAKTRLIWDCWDVETLRNFILLSRSHFDS